MGFLPDFFSVMARARGDFPIPAVVLSKGELPSPFMRSLVLKTPIIETGIPKTA